MTVLITLTIAGSDSGPFDLYSNVDGYTSAFETGVSKAALMAGYSSALVPNGTTIVRVKSTGVCTNYIDITLVTTTTTTSTSTTTTTTTTVPFTSWEARYSNSIGAVCATPSVIVYTASGASFTTGDTVYTDSGLTTPLLGFDYISELVSGTVYAINSGTGIIGANTGNTC